MRRILSAGGAVALSSALVLAGATGALADDVSAPGAPAGWVSAVPGNGTVTLSWSEPTSDGGSPVTAYDISMSFNAGLSWSAPIRTPTSATTFVLRKLANGALYRFRVSAVNAVGPGPQLEDSPRAMPGRPDAPAGWQESTPGNGQVLLQWNPPVNAGGSAVTGYRIEVSDDAGATWSVARRDTRSTATFFTVTGLTNGVAHTFRVSAVTALGVRGLPLVGATTTPRARLLTIFAELPATASLGWPTKVTWNATGAPRRSVITADIVVTDGDGGVIPVSAVVQPKRGQTQGSATFALPREGTYSVSVRATATRASGGRLGVETTTLTVASVTGSASYRTSVRSVTADDVSFSYRKGCPVKPSDLRVVSIPYWNFDDDVVLGSLVVAEVIVDDMVQAFGRAYEERFPIHSMIPIDEFYRDGDTVRTPEAADRASMAANNTSAFNCRQVVGNSSSSSPHSYGEAFDINPFQNPYVTKDATYPAAAAKPYHRQRASNLQDKGVLTKKTGFVKELLSLKWVWGADWRFPDYQHFQSRYPMVPVDDGTDTGDGSGGGSGGGSDCIPTPFGLYCPA